MDGFLEAQVEDPFDNTLMLIHADWLEESGDCTSSFVFRQLNEMGYASLIAFACASYAIDVAFYPDYMSSYPGYYMEGHGGGDNIPLHHGYSNPQEIQEHAVVDDVEDPVVIDGDGGDTIYGDEDVNSWS